MATSLISPKKRGVPKRQANKSYNGKRLTWQMEEFCFHLMADVQRNGVRAAEKAGYKAPHVAATKLLKNRLVRARLGKEKMMREKEARKTAADVIQYLETAVFFNPLKYFSPGGNGGWTIKAEDLEALPEAIGALIEECEDRTIETRDSTIRMCWVRFVSKTKMVEFLAKHHGLFEKDNRQKCLIDLSQLCEDPEIDDPVERLIKNPEPRRIADAKPVEPVKPVKYSVADLVEDN